MPRRIEETVAENRSGRKRLEGYAIEVSSDATRDYVFTGNTVEVAVGIDVYTRPLGNTMVMGHPQAKHGMGRGGMGDAREGWTKVASTKETGAFTAGGRETVVDALEGGRVGLAGVLVGSGASAAAVGDDALESRAGSTFAFGLKDAYNVTRARGSFRFQEFGDAVSEYGVENGDGTLMSRLTTTTVNPGLDEELKIEVTFTFEGSGIGDSVITTDGETGIANSIQIASETVGLYEVAIGTSSVDPLKSDSSLATEYDRKRAARDGGNENIRAYVKWYQGEPSGQPVNLSELGVFDYDGNLIWRATFDTFEKNSNFPFQGGAQIRVI